MSRLRHTPQRRLVLASLKLSPAPLTAEEVITRVRRAARRVSLSTVYRNLDLLTERGEIFRLVGSDGTHRFAGTIQAATTFTCVECGRIEQHQLPALDWLARHLAPRQVSAATVAVQGRCLSCQNKHHAR